MLRISRLVQFMLLCFCIAVLLTIGKSIVNRSYDLVFTMLRLSLELFCCVFSLLLIRHLYYKGLERIEFHRGLVPNLDKEPVHSVQTAYAMKAVTVVGAFSWLTVLASISTVGAAIMCIPICKFAKDIWRNCDAKTRSTPDREARSLDR